MIGSFEFNKLPGTAPDAGATKLLHCWLDLQELPHDKTAGGHMSSTFTAVGLRQV